MRRPIQGRERVNSSEALITALTQQPVPDVIEANSIFVQLHSRGDMSGSGATQNSGLEFTRSVMTLTASISGTTDQETTQTTTSKTSPSTSTVCLTIRHGERLHRDGRVDRDTPSKAADRTTMQPIADRPREVC